ncbi:ADP-ribosylglycohydrolase [Promicromonospora sp. AC04]|uniref:ADP-ribosylglycohydrolase family protein n=1 Tax=Promicromonospora sp. AC04 TaxID=2135723 RepID=UPI000D3D1C64|nr:ADP-ribosylglycohydrolase family protein [Promicromonospora sp. AC04]PUB25267.1 ADP-ribosylglycohydrolase [Promicromonospora sp. AC04]
MTDDRLDRAVGAVHGLALGDALGAPASEHRTVRDPWVRQMLRKGALELDESRVLRPVVPFVLTAIDSPPLVATDDTETFAVAARVLLDSPTRDDGDLFDTWRALLDTPDTWTGPAQRSALLNAAAGLRPPHTGADNPAFYDDTALPGALAAAIAGGDPAGAADLARRYATITHDGIGVHAAVVFARLVGHLLDGAPIRDALDAVADDLADDDWLADGVRDALGIVDGARSPFGAVPALVARFAPRTYSHPGTVAETLPLALALTAATQGDHETALPLALTVARHQDSLPGLVGALCGASGSAPDAADLDVLQGITIPAVAGQSLTALATGLVTRRP